MLGHMVVMAKVRIGPVGDEVHTTVSADGKVWRKKYKSMPEATTEAVELRIMTESEKQYVDGAQRQPTWSDRGYEPPIPFEIYPDELKARGFLLDS
jgi:hypothetical protein